MTMLIIHPGTGTIMCADECLLLDDDQFETEIHDAIVHDQNVDDLIVELAVRIGTPVVLENREN